MNSLNDPQLQKKIEEDERIVHYLRGEMTACEESAFFDDLNKDAELRDRAIIQARMIKGMRQIDEEIIELLDEASKSTIKSRSFNAVIKHWLAIAASIVFVVFIGLKSYDYYNTTSLGKEYTNTFPISTIIRGESNDDVDTELTSLFNKVSNAEDLDFTTQRLAELWELAKQETYNDYSDYAPYIGWNLAIAYLRNYNKSKAKCILEEMAELYSVDSAIGKKVRSIQEKL